MAFALLGLESTLAREDCARVELHSTSDGSVLAFIREREDVWASDDLESDPLHTKELWERIQSEFGRTCDRVVCLLPEEAVVYAAEKGGVNISRSPRAGIRAGAEPEGADLEAVVNALGIPRSKRRAKLKQARQFGRIVELALPETKQTELRVLDLACGRSYLGFVLVKLLAARGHRVRLHGVDSNPTFVDRSREIARTLGWQNSTFEVGDLAAYSVEPETYDIVVLLHGCDTLTDEAIRIACEARTPLIFVAPCCQHELRHQWKKHPLQWVSRYGLLEQRLADVLTDAFRCLVMQALGYQTKVIRFVDPDVTPKNLLIQGRLTSGPRPDRAREAAAFVKQFGVWPRLVDVLKTAGLWPHKD